MPAIDGNIAPAATPVERMKILAAGNGAQLRVTGPAELTITLAEPGDEVAVMRRVNRATEIIGRSYTWTARDPLTVVVEIL